MFLPFIQRFSRCLLLAEATTNSIKQHKKYLLVIDKFYHSEAKNFNTPSKRPHDEVGDLLSKFKSIPSNDDWDDLRNTVLKQQRLINKNNIDAIVLGFCINNLNFAKSYVHYLKSNNIEPNFATIGKFLKSYHAHYENKNTPADEIAVISGWCDKLLKLGVLDSTTADNVIHGLVLTPRWKECLKLLDMIKIASNPKGVTYSVIISTAFANDESDIGWKLFIEMVESQRQPTCSVYESWVNHCLQKHEHHKDKSVLLNDLEKMLNLIAEYDIKISKLAGMKFVEAFEKLGWEGETSVIVKGAHCKSCQEKLPGIKVLVNDFKKLQEEFLKRVLIRRDVFVRSNPAELKKFRDIIEKTAPYDVVVDGLNVAYGTGRKTPIEMINGLLNVVQHFADLDKNILVLGRKHMNRWPQKQLKYIQSKAHIFLADDLSYDDPFLLQAAITSGPNTIMVSRDLMRGHRFLLKDPLLRETFKKWQLSKQYQVLRHNKDGTVVFSPPLKYLPSAQKTKNAWHIPIIEQYTPNVPFTLEPPLEWICIREKS